MLDLALPPPAGFKGRGKEEKRLERVRTLGVEPVPFLNPHQCPEQLPGAMEITVPGYSLSTGKPERVRRSAGHLCDVEKRPREEVCSAFP